MSELLYILQILQFPLRPVPYLPGRGGGACQNTASCSYIVPEGINFYLAVFASTVYNDNCMLCKKLLSGVNVTIVTNKLFQDSITETLVTDSNGTCVSKNTYIWPITYISRTITVQRNDLDFGNGIGKSYQLDEFKDTLDVLRDNNPNPFPIIGTKLLAQILS